MVRLCRPEQWIKNVIVLAAVVFGFKMGQAASWLKALTAVAAFCLMSSASYVFNDIFDIRSDRTHPKKKLRPLAAGQVGIKEAGAMTIALVLAGVAAAHGLGALFYIVLIAYFALHVGYTLVFKKQVLIDVICIALGFVLRAVGGAVAIRVEVSPWLIICTFMLCLFMGFCKRYSETVYIGPSQLEKHRVTLIRYTPHLLNHLITFSATLAVVSFLLYAINERTVEHFGTIYMVYLVPLVVYAVFRFAMLSMEGAYTDPTELILKDKPFQFTAALWGIGALSIIVWGPDIQHWAATQF